MIERNSIHKKPLVIYSVGWDLFFNWGVNWGIRPRIFIYVRWVLLLKKPGPPPTQHFLKVNTHLHLITYGFKISSIHNEILQAA